MRAVATSGWLLAIVLVVGACGQGEQTSEDPTFASLRMRVERDNGMPCAQLNVQVMSFVSQKVTPMVAAGRQSSDWCASAQQSTWEQIAKYREPAFQCHLLQGSARRHGYSMEGDFETLQELLSALDTFGRTRSNCPGFDKIEKLYTTLVFSSRAADTKCPGCGIVLELK